MVLVRIIGVDLWAGGRAKGSTNTNAMEEVEGIQNILHSQHKHSEGWRTKTKGIKAAKEGFLQLSFPQFL